MALMILGLFFHSLSARREFSCIMVDLVGLDSHQLMLPEAERRIAAQGGRAARYS